MKARPKTSHNESGFTVLELMIATTVLSVILLLATTLMIGIGNLYYKGDNEARIQDGVRAAADQMTQDIQFSASPAAPATSVNLQTFASAYNDGTKVDAFCISTLSNEIRYSYVNNPKYEIGSGGYNTTNPQLLHLLWRDELPINNACQPADLAVANPDIASAPNHGTANTGSELVPANSRLTSFCISTAGFNTQDFGCTAPASSDANNYSISLGMAFGTPDLTTSTGGVYTCKGGAGDSFCATNSLTSVITQRTPATQ